MMGMGLGHAIDEVLAAKMAELSKQMRGETAALHQKALAELKAEGLVSEDTNIRDASVKSASDEFMALPRKHKVWREMLRLVINGIAYLSSYSDDSQRVWSKRTPADLLEQLAKGTPKVQQRAQSKLAALGYVPVHLCGRKFAEMVEQQIDTGSQREGKRPSWVRGSWVWQPHGPQHSLRRLQWRMPHLRNKNEDGEPLGHLYLAS